MLHLSPSQKEARDPGPEGKKQNIHTEVACRNTGFPQAEGCVPAAEGSLVLFLNMEPFAWERDDLEEICGFLAL